MIFLGLADEVTFSEAVVNDLGRSFYCSVHLLPGTTVGKGPPDVGADG